MARTLIQLMQKTPQSRRLPSEHIKLVALKLTKNAQSHQMIMAKTRSMIDREGYSIPGYKRITYISTIEFLPKKAVIVSCSCDDFLYRLEYYLKKAGAARIEYSNGKKPVPPRANEGGAFMCKHLYALSTHVLEQKGKI